jgi:cyanophycin synthetase
MLSYLYILSVILITYYLYKKIFTLREGILFTSSYFLDKYKKDDILIDRENITLERYGKKINYKNINNISDNRFINNKPLTNNLLYKNSIPVSNSYTWDNNLSSEENLQFTNSLQFPLVVKPIKGEQGYGVTTDITSNAELLQHINNLKNQDKEVLIEEQAKGKEYRIMVLNDKIIGITMKTPPSIIGDGENTINQLITNYNNKKAKDYQIHKIDYNYIKKQGYDSNDILSQGEKIIITNVANMHNGSVVEYVDINNVNPVNISLFKKINNVLGLKLSGIDYICEDLTIPYYLNGCVIEVNSNPGLDIHYAVYPNNKREELLDNVIHNVFI